MKREAEEDRWSVVRRSRSRSDEVGAEVGRCSVRSAEEVCGLACGFRVKGIH